jgi:adenylosuccinate synthase
MHVPRNEAVRKSLRPVYTSLPGWRESLSGVRRYANLPAAARSYIAAMMRSVLDVAYEGEPRPATLPNLRYLGVGPDPAQIIRDIPPTAELIKPPC